MRSTVDPLSFLFAFGLVSAVSAFQPDLGLKISVLEGEDGVNIIQQKTAVQPIVEVRDKNNLPVAGVTVTFTVLATGASGGLPAAFGNGASRVGVITDGAGHATVSGLQPMSDGSFNLGVEASMNGQTASTTITQTNFQTAADAVAAGKTPGASTGKGAEQARSNSTSQQQTEPQSQTQSQASNAGSSTSSGAGSVAGAGAATGGGLGAGAITGIAIGGVAAAGFGAYQAGLLDSIFPVCRAEEEATNNAANTFSNNFDSYINCLDNARTDTQLEACYRRYAGPLNDALGDWCACGGNRLSDEDRQTITELLALMRGNNLYRGSLAQCNQ